MGVTNPDNILWSYHFLDMFVVIGIVVAIIIVIIVGIIYHFHQPIHGIEKMKLPTRYSHEYI